jgi:thiol-disulfide isomerase/thioredoxin
MNYRTVLTRGAIAVLGLLLVFTVAKAAGGKSSLEGKPAPDFTLRSLDGKEVTLSKLKGNVVVLDFWATWCPPCRASLPHLSKVANDAALKEKGLKVVGVNCKEDNAKVEAFLKKSNLHLHVAMDSEGATMNEYQVRGIPTTVVVGRDGVIQNLFIGFGGEKSEVALDKAIEKALAGK